MPDTSSSPKAAADLRSRSPVPAQDRPAKPHRLADAGGLVVLLMVVLLFAGPGVLFALRMQATGSSAVPLSKEVTVLLGAALLSLFLPLMQIVVHIRRYGGAAVRGNRDDFPAIDGLAARLARAHANLIESLVPFAIVVLTVHAFHASTRWTVAAAVLYLAARVVHAVTYLLGITVLRSAAFYAGALATGFVAVALLAA